MKSGVKQAILDGSGTVIGAMIMAFGISLFLLPNQLSTGGFSGIATITYYLFNIPMGLMNLILNREINGYKLHDDVKILAAMNPSSKYGSDFDYQVVDMDAAQENRFVWLNMEPDYNQWLNWAMDSGIEQKVIEFISTFPEYLHRINEDDVRATPRSYERVSKSYKVYKEQKDSIPRNVFLNVIKGNVGKIIAEEFISFVESDCSQLISYEDVFYFQLKNKLKKDDLILAISGSGNSKNVIKAVEYAKIVGTKTVGVTGFLGGKLREMADYHMHVNVDDMQITEDIHMAFDHMMYRVLTDTLNNSGEER